MHIINPLHQHSERIDAFARSLRLWVLELAVLLVMMMKSRAGKIQLQHLIIEARQDMRVLIALRMVQRMRIHPGRRSATWHVYRAAAPPGFRLQTRRGRRLRLFTRGIALKTIRDMQRVLKNLDAVVTRALARLPKRSRPGRRILRSADDLVRVTPSTRNADEAVRAPDTS
jgi:hypothetical protein